MESISETRDTESKFDRLALVALGPVRPKFTLGGYRSIPSSRRVPRRLQWTDSHLDWY